MKQFVLDRWPDELTGLIELGQKDFHYLVDVRRLKENETLTVLLPDGAQSLARIQKISQKNISLHIEKSFENSVNSDAKIILALALLKGSKHDDIVRQATEIGVHALYFFEAEHSVARFSENSKLERYKTIAKEAAQQSGNRVLPEIEIFASWEKLYATKIEAVDTCFFGFCHEKQIDSKSIHEYCSQNHGYFVICIGPEGGFSAHEISVFQAQGGRPIYLGDTVLRAETAALFSLSAFRVVMGEFDEWQKKKN